MKILFLTLLSLNLNAQYQGIELTDADLDPRPIVKDMGTPPKDLKESNVDETRREIASKNVDGVKRAPAIIEDNGVSK